MKLIFFLFMFIFLNLANCQTPYQEAEEFTKQLKNNPQSLIEMVESKKIKIHSTLMKDIDNGNYPLKLIAWEIKRFYKRNQNIIEQHSENRIDFYSNSWREQFEIKNFKYLSIKYFSPNKQDTLQYEFLIDRSNELILFEIRSNLMRNIAEFFIYNSSVINIADNSNDFILYQSLKDKIEFGKINLTILSDSIRVFKHVDEKLYYQILNNKIYFKTNDYRKKINIDDLEYQIIYCYKKIYNKAIEFEFLIDTEKDILYLYYLSYGIFIR